VFDRLLARFGKRRQPVTDREIAEEEALRRQAEKELREAETRMAEQRQKIEGGGQGRAGGWGGWT
jgi:hypothetical protein